MDDLDVDSKHQESAGRELRYVGLRLVEGAVMLSRLTESQGAIEIPTNERNRPVQSLCESLQPFGFKGQVVGDGVYWRLESKNADRFIKGIDEAMNNAAREGRSDLELREHAWDVRSEEVRDESVPPGDSSKASPASEIKLHKIGEKWHVKGKSGEGHWYYASPLHSDHERIDVQLFSSSDEYAGGYSFLPARGELRLLIIMPGYAKKGAVDVLLEDMRLRALKPKTTFRTLLAHAGLGQDGINEFNGTVDEYRGVLAGVSSEASVHEIRLEPRPLLRNLTSAINAEYREHSAYIRGRTNI